VECPLDDVLSDLAGQQGKLLLLAEFHLSASCYKKAKNISMAGTRE
jgi:hypothetical protein